MKTNPRYLLTIPESLPAAEIAAVLRRSPRRLRQLADAGVIPQPQRGKYRFTETVQAYLAHLQRRLDTARRSGRGRKTRLQAELLQLEIEEKREGLMPFDLAKQKIEMALRPVRSALESLPAEMAIRCNPGDPAFARCALARWVKDRTRMIGAADSAQTEKPKRIHRG